ncbi:MAG: hypothetical protein V4539_17195 [Bacteroidota bacterium]
MKKLIWFTHTGIACQNYAQLDFDLSFVLQTFLEKEVWTKRLYRTEYSWTFDKDDFQKIKTVKVHIHSSGAPLSQFHAYENILSKYVAFDQIEKTKLFSSGITEVRRIAVIEVEFESQYAMIPVLSYEQEMDIDTVMGQLEYSDHWEELRRLKTIVTEILQFFMFNMHLNFLTEDYTFSVTDKPELSGLTVVSEGSDLFYETDRIELLSHYILYEKEKDKLVKLMEATAEFWCRDIPTIHFFMEALKGNHLTYTHFSKLVFTVESFFAQRITNDYMTLVIPLLICQDQKDMNVIRQLMRKCFTIRNEIVHGGDIPGFRTVKGKEQGKEKRLDDYFFELKNLITRLLYWYINHRGFESAEYRLTHEKIFELLPNGIGNYNKKDQ